MLDIKTLESWLWECACKIRGEIDAPKVKYCINKENWQKARKCFEQFFAINSNNAKSNCK